MLVAATVALTRADSESWMRKLRVAAGKPPRNNAPSEFDLAYMNATKATRLTDD